MQLTYKGGRFEFLAEWIRHRSLGVLAVYGLTIYVFALALQSFVMGIDFRLMTGQLVHAGIEADPFYEMGAGLGFWAVIFFCLNFVLATRWRWVENIFGGLDKVYQLHGLAGKLGLIMVLAHMGILVVQALPDTALIGTYLLPGLDLGYSLGVLGVLSMVLLVAATIWVRMPYGVWLNSHKWMIVPYLAGTSHAFVLQQDWYMLVLSIVGGYAWLYTTFLYRRFAPRAKGQIEAFQFRNGINDLHIRLETPFQAQPGQFIYLSVTGSQHIRPESHPFSISGYSMGGIRLSIKALGDYTRSLQALQLGDRVTVFGPYGRFGDRSLASTRFQVWLAGGIGVTPFLSLAQQAAQAQRPIEGILIWSVRERSDAVFIEELHDWIDALPGMRLELHVSTETGYLTADQLSAIVGEDQLKAAEVFICGPAMMMQTITRQLVACGMRRSRIFTEDFNLKP